MGGKMTPDTAPFLFVFHLYSKNNFIKSYNEFALYPLDEKVLLNTHSL